MPNKKSIVHTDDKEKIMSFFPGRSDSMYKYLKSFHSEFSFWYRTLSHSDILNKGKRTNISDGFDKNLLYYMSVEDRVSPQEQCPNRKFECAKQSNIGMPGNDNEQDNVFLP